MSHSETQLESRTVFEGRVITVTFDKVRQIGRASCRERV